MHFDEDLIIREAVAKSNEDIIEQMAEKLYEKGLVKKTYIDAVIEREHHFATGLPTNGYSVAIPHTDVEHVNKKSISLAILKDSVDFGVMGEETATTPVKLVFMLAMDQKHSQLELLKKLMSIFSNPETLQTIVKEECKTNIKELVLNLLNPQPEGGE